MDHIFKHDLHTTVQLEDRTSIYQYVRDYENEILDRWTEQPHDDFENFLRLSEQKLSRAKRTLDMHNAKIFTSYYLGILEGIILVFRKLFKNEERDQKIISVFAAQSPKTDQILECLYTQNSGQGMRHGELADKLNISYSALTNNMKRILQSGAVDAARSGKNTYYTLTKSGRRYCNSKAKEPKSFSKKELLSAFSSFLDQTTTKQYPVGQTSLSIKPGDKFKLIAGSKEQDLILNSVIKVFHEKYAICEDNIDDIPVDHSIDSEHIVSDMILENLSLSLESNIVST